MDDETNEVTRRDFLKTAAAVTALAALPPAGGMPAMLTVPSPGSTVNYGIIGTGTEGCQLLSSLTRVPGARCVATSDIYPPNQKRGIATAGSNPQLYENYHQLLDRKDVDAVLIAVPLNLHTQMVLDALSAGKHVFVEKTMFFKEEEEKPIREAAAAHPKQVLQIGLQRRSDMLYRIAMDMIKDGAIGKVMFMRAQWHRNNDWRRPVPDPKFERLINWRMYREYSGGLMAELASHQIDIANWAFGAEPLSVVGTGGIDYWKDGRETDDNAQVILEYPAGRKMVWTSILYNTHYQFNEQIMGDRGTIEITLGKGLYYREPAAKVTQGAAKENWWAGATVTELADQQGSPIIPEITPPSEGFVAREQRFAREWLIRHGYRTMPSNDAWYEELTNYVASVRDGKPIACPLELGVADARAVIYGNRAIDTGQKVFWPKAQG
ncbi:MAG TPA: Gfo/Idh/MocA family oxidoreductase [Terriglobia bacterium]|nr:Gfo/Idh/MocA family oxidoreductase [Terriglobia bacterium]